MMRHNYYIKKERERSETLALNVLFGWVVVASVALIVFGVCFLKVVNSANDFAADQKHIAADIKANPDLYRR